MDIRVVRREFRRVLLLSVLGGMLVALPAGSETPAGSAARPEPARAPAEDAAPPVGLDTLLRLPPATSVPKQPQKGGEGPSEWRARFAQARGELESAERALAEAQGELEKLASDRESWQVSAPGGQAGGDTGPLSFSLRQEIRRQREAVERAERALDELRIEANLEGVPEEWMQDAPAEGASPDPDAPR